MLLNVSNHPSEKWPTEQIEAAVKEFGEPIFDIPFPEVPPEGDSNIVYLLANELENKIAEAVKANKFMQSTVAVLLMGEFSLCYELIRRLRKAAFLKIVVATTKRNVVEENGVKKSVFKFVRFREIK